MPVQPWQVILGHTPFQDLVLLHRDEPVLAVGKHEPDAVLANYGFCRVVHIDDYSRRFANIDPLAAHKKGLERPPGPPGGAAAREEEGEQAIGAVFVVSDPVDWGRDLQVLCDVLRSGGRPGRPDGGRQPRLYFAADDFEYPAKFAVPRFGMGAFRVALAALYERLTGRHLAHVSYGKPSAAPYRLAQSRLSQAAAMAATAAAAFSSSAGSGEPPAAPGEGAEAAAGRHVAPLRRYYMVGDNPRTDIQGAKQAGPHWASLLTRTGLHQSEDNDPHFSADKVVADVSEAVEYVLRTEGAWPAP